MTDYLARYEGSLTDDEKSFCQEVRERIGGTSEPLLAEELRHVITMVEMTAMVMERGGVERPEMMVRSIGNLIGLIADAIEGSVPQVKPQ